MIFHVGEQGLFRTLPLSSLLRYCVPGLRCVPISQIRTKMGHLQMFTPECCYFCEIGKNLDFFFDMLWTNKQTDKQERHSYLCQGLKVHLSSCLMQNQTHRPTTEKLDNTTSGVWWICGLKRMSTFLISQTSRICI